MESIARKGFRVYNGGGIQHGWLAETGSGTLIIWLATFM